MRKLLFLAVLLSGLANAQMRSGFERYKTDAPTVCDAFLSLPSELRFFRQTAVLAMVGKWDMPVPGSLLDMGVLFQPGWKASVTRTLGDGFTEVSVVNLNAKPGLMYLYLDAYQRDRTRVCAFTID